MKLGIALDPADPWGFFSEIFVDLQKNYQTSVFKRRSYQLPIFNARINRYLFNQDLQTFMQTNDIVFFEWASELLMKASHMPKKCRIITRLHSFELYEWAPKINWESVDKIILVSNAMQSMYCDLYPKHTQKTEVVYNGISLTLFNPKQQYNFNFNLGMLCRITPIKRVYEVILILSDLKKFGYNAQLHIAGEVTGDQRYVSAIHRMIKKLDLQDNVILYGHVTDTPAWLKNIDIFISNSFWEGQQVALIEAMASGCYCLSHFWAGADEMLPLDNLYITESELHQKIIGFAELPNQTKQMKQDQLRSIAYEKFDINETKVKIKQIIESVTAS